jgi:hypothetical protein
MEVAATVNVTLVLGAEFGSGRMRTCRLVGCAVMRGNARTWSEALLLRRAPAEWLKRFVSFSTVGFQMDHL